MPKIAKRTLIAIALFVLATFLILALQVDDWSRDLTTNRAATSENAIDPLLLPLEIAAPTEEVRAAIQQFADSSPAWSLQSNESNSPTKIHLVRTSPLFRFADDIQVTLQPTPTGTRVNATSQSRVGKGDLGQNPRNLRELMQELRKLL